MRSTLAERLAEAMAGPPRASSAEIARVCGVKPPSVSDWLSGRSKRMDAENLLKVARHCRVSPDWLCFGLGRKEQTDRWPFPMFPPEDYELIAPAYRHRIENELAGEIQRIKRLGNGKAA